MWFASGEGNGDDALVQGEGEGYVRAWVLMRAGTVGIPLASGYVIRF